MFKQGLLLAAGLWIMAFGTAFAHAKLQSSSPAADSRLAASPPMLTLNFSEKAQLAMLKLTQDGKDVPISLDRGAKAASSITVTLPVLMPGNYQVRWTALAADDGHVTKGSFSFSILTAKAT